MPAYAKLLEPRSELTIKFRNVSIENGVQLVCRLLQADEVHNYTVVSEFYYDLMIESGYSQYSVSLPRNCY